MSERTEERHRMAVAAHLILKDGHGRMLFMRRANTGYADGCWSIPAGHVEQGEPVDATVVRETAEEVGVALREGDVECVLVQHKHDFDGEDRVDFFFEASLPLGAEAIIGEPHKCDGLAWRAIDERPAPVVAYVAAALDALGTPGHPMLSYYGFDGPVAR